MRESNKMIFIILATALITAIVLIIAFVAWFELFMPYRVVVPRSPFYHVAIPGEPPASARLYWLGTPRLGSDRHLLVLKSRYSKRPESYQIDFSKRRIGLPDFPQHIPLFGSAVVNRDTLVGFPLLGELKAEWSDNDRETRIRLIGSSDVANKALSHSPEQAEEAARRLIPIGYQREIIFTKTKMGRKWDGKWPEEKIKMGQSP